MDLRDARSRVLMAHGADPSTLDELRAYTQRSFDVPVRPNFPLADEPHLVDWLEYAKEAAADAVAALGRHFVQLRFPIRAKISQDPAYLAATRKGRSEEADAFAPGLVLSNPAGIELQICTTIAGRVPVLVAADRTDFVALVQAFTERNEPVPVPSAMGACIVTGLNNWDRVAAYRAQWTRDHPDDAESEWPEEFRRMAARKELYQDRFIILSRGPYSAIPSQAVGMGVDEWLERSLTIRREHECTHYFTYRVFGSMRNHVRDELIADFVGLLFAFGDYRGDLAARFLGLEAFPALRSDARLFIYCGSLSEPAIRTVAALAVAAIGNLQAVGARWGAAAVQDLSALATLTYGLSALTLEDLASAELPWLLENALEQRR